ncbi:hypothetical protein D3C87_938060 [compost metagenome]
MSILPAKFLMLSISNISDREYWIDESATPPTWNYYPFKWLIECNIELQNHSSDKTPTPFMYTGSDIVVGDWFSDDTGYVYRISEIVYQDLFSAQLVIEDVGQYNTNNDPSAQGQGQPRAFSGFIFTLAENGLPDIQSMPIARFSPEVFTSVQSRFQARNLVSEFVTIYQTNNGFALGDFIKVDEANEGRFELCAANEINLAVGIVNGANTPKTDYFTFKPLTEILENVQPPLVGAYGDIFYIDPANPGKVTNVKPASDAKPVYIRLETETRAVRLNAIVDENSITVVHKVETTTLDQVEFTLPAEAKSVQAMSINGIENKNFTFDDTTKVITFDPVATGYGVEETDEVIFVYNT